MAPSLPTAHVLSYVARADSPNRVRRITAWAMVTQASLYTLATLVLGYIVFDELHNQFTLDDIRYAFGGAPRTRWMTAEELRTLLLKRVFCETPAIPAILSAALALAAWTTVSPLRRGRRGAAILAMPVVGVTMLVNALIAATSLVWTPAGIFPIFDTEHAAPAYLLLLIPAVLCTILSAACFDLFTFLSWIKRQNEGEAPLRKFIS